MNHNEVVFDPINFPSVTLAPIESTDYHDYLVGAKATKRHKDWNDKRIEKVRKTPFCEFCKGVKLLQVHHKKPFHLWPELEMEDDNLCVLCEANRCHVMAGHLGNYKSYNPLINQLLKLVVDKPFDKNDLIWESKNVFSV